MSERDGFVTKVDPENSFRHNLPRKREPVISILHVYSSFFMFTYHSSEGVEEDLDEIGDIDLRHHLGRRG